MLNFPKSLHQLHIFEEEGKLYAADLDKAQLVEISAVIADILKLAETRTTEEITDALKTIYDDTEIAQAFRDINPSVMDKVCLFNRGENPTNPLLQEKDSNSPLSIVGTVARINA